MYSFTWSEVETCCRDDSEQMKFNDLIKLSINCIAMPYHIYIPQTKILMFLEKSKNGVNFKLQENFFGESSSFII